MKTLKFNTKKDGNPFYDIKKNFNFDDWNEPAHINLINYKNSGFKRLEIVFYKENKYYTINFYHLDSFDEIKEEIQKKIENIDDEIDRSICKEKEFNKMAEESELFKRNMESKYPDVKYYLNELFRGF